MPDFAWILTQTRGRLARKWFWLGQLTFFAATVSLILIGAALDIGMFGTVAPIFIAYLVIGVSPSAKRAHDRGKPASYGVLLFFGAFFAEWARRTATAHDVESRFELLLSAISIVIGGWYLLELGFLRGTVGVNQYGPDPCEDDPRQP